MSSSETDPNFFTAFLDDYFAECEEHLTALRRNLLELERFVNQPQIERSLIDELFRSFHSLKGLSGMVGFKAAEQLAHHMESYLRLLRDKQVLLAPEGMDALINGTKFLERVIAAHHSKTPVPDVEPAIAQLMAILPEDPASTPIKVAAKPKSEGESSSSPQPPVSTAAHLSPLTLKPEESEKLTAALEKGAKAWQFEFVPDPALSQRGMNVNKVRERLGSIGKLIHAAPRVTSNGGIVFDFLITSSENEATFVDWCSDGLSYAPYSEASEQIAEEGDKGDKGDEEQPYPQPLSVEQRGEYNGEAEDAIDTLHLPEMVEAEEQNALQVSGELESESASIPAAPVPSASPAQTGTATAVAASNVVRVELTRLDELMQMVGELVITRARLEDQLKSLKGVLPAAELRTLKETNLTLEHQLRDLRQGVMRVRLVPIGEIFARMQFVIRDLARESQKQIGLELSGQGTEIDKFVVERMIDPLLHLVRNAVSHGLESEAERARWGKPPEGKISLRASTAGEMVVIEVEDDGRGVDAEAVTRRAKEQGLIANEMQPDTATLLDILCSSGFSTREQADLTSGRGVGMAVVKKTVQELGGFMMLDTQVGRGSRFTIQLPLTLAIADALVVSVGGQIFTVPLSSVREVLEIQASAITVLENNEIFAHRGNVLPLVRLARLFGLDENGVKGSTGELRDRQSPFLHVVVLGSGLNAVGILVNRIIGQREIVVRPLTDPLVQVIGIAGATELGDGRVVLILDTAALLQVGKLSNRKVGKLKPLKIGQG